MREILIGIPVILSAIVTGQQPSLTCLSDVGVYAKNGPRVFVKFIPQSTVITKTIERVAWTTSVNNHARVKVIPAISGRTATFVFQESTWVGSPSGFSYKAGAGTATKTLQQPHSWLLKVPANPAGNVLLVKMKSTRTPWPDVVQRGQLDIGNDKQLELDQDLSKAPVERTFNLGTKAVDIRIVTHGDYPSMHAGGYAFEVGLTLNPDTPLKFKSYGPFCGMKLDMSSVLSGSGHSITASVQGGFYGQGSILLLGVKPMVMVLPGTPCLILVHGLITVRLPDTRGASTTTFPVPGRVDGLIYVQAVSAYAAFGLTSFRMSNGIQIDGR